MTKTPWNKNKAVGQKAYLTDTDIIMLQGKLAHECKTKELALLNLALATDMKANALLRLKVIDIKTHKNYKIVRDLIISEDKKEGDYLFSNKQGGHISRNYYARLVKKWVKMIGLDPGEYSTRSITISQQPHNLSSN